MIINRQQVVKMIRIAGVIILFPSQNLNKIIVEMQEMHTAHCY